MTRKLLFSLLSSLANLPGVQQECFGRLGVRSLNRFCALSGVVDHGALCFAEALPHAIDRVINGLHSLCNGLNQGSLDLTFGEGLVERLERGLDLRQRRQDGPRVGVKTDADVEIVIAGVHLLWLLVLFSSPLLPLGCVGQVDGVKVLYDLQILEPLRWGVNPQQTDISLDLRDQDGA